MLAGAVSVKRWVYERPPPTLSAISQQVEPATEGLLITMVPEGHCAIARSAIHIMSAPKSAATTKA